MASQLTVQLREPASAKGSQNEKERPIPSIASSAKLSGVSTLPPPSEGDVATTFNMMKGIMGAGGFAMPWAFARLGVVGGLVAIAACTLCGSWTAGELLQLKQRVESRRRFRSATYVDMARAALGHRGADCVFALTLVCSLGTTSAYLVFIATTLHSLLPAVSQQSITVMAAVVVTPITWVPNFSCLSALAQSGTYAVLAGYAVTLYYGFEEASQRGEPRREVLLVGSPASSAAGLGPIAFLFLIHFVLSPIMTASKAATPPGHFQSLAVAAFGIAAVVNGIFGSLCLFLFGTSVSSIVVNDIAKGSICLTLTKAMLCIDLFCSYPLIFSSGREIIESCFLEEPEVEEAETHAACPQTDGSDLEEEGAPSASTIDPDDLPQAAGLDWRRCLIRSALVLTTLGIAQLQDFGMIISLVGSLGQATLGLVLPQIMALRLLGESMSTWRWMINAITIPAGLGIASIATGATLAEACGVKL